ncbi:MAG: six-cysteine peptide SCIFF [Firmicutes bacterium]|nr:six-cysteine peptide SCIFF [Bacillota bacterium]
MITVNPEVGQFFGSNTGCGECPTSCQSACKTSCTVANQPCIRETTE